VGSVLGEMAWRLPGVPLGTALGMEIFREHKVNGQTPIPAHVWTNYLKGHFTPEQTSPPRDQVPRVPCAHQALSNRLRTRTWRQITPADIAIPLGPGGSYRKRSDTNTFSQLRPDYPSLYDTPVETLLSTHIE